MQYTNTRCIQDDISFMYSVWPSVWFVQKLYFCSREIFALSLFLLPFTLKRSQLRTICNIKRKCGRTFWLIIALKWEFRSLLTCCHFSSFCNLNWDMLSRRWIRSAIGFILITANFSSFLQLLWQNKACQHTKPQSLYLELQGSDLYKIDNMAPSQKGSTLHRIWKLIQV